MKIKKIVALLLALLMVALPLCACKKDGGSGDGDNEVKEEVQKNDEMPVVEYTREKYAGYDYDGYDFRILSINRGSHYYFMLDGETGFANEVWYEEDSAEAQQHSVFTRNTLASELLDITISPVWGGGTYEIDSLIKTLVKSGSDDFDMTIGSQCRSLPLATEGYFRNLTEIETLDLGEEWWDQEYINTFIYKNKYLFTVCGDYNIFDDYATPVVFYNKQVLDNYNLDDPADLVDAGTWTIDAMMDYVGKVTSDISGDGKLDENDVWGMTDNNIYMFHFATGCNLHLSALDDEGVPQVTIDSEQFTNTVQTIFDKIAMSGKCLFTDNGTCYDLLKDDRALFYYEILAGINLLRDMESDFSLLPTPKLNEEQESYGSLAQGIYLTVVSVPLSAKNVDRTGIIMNVLGGMSTDTVDAALHEVVLGPKLFREKRTRDMLTYALENRKYDWAENINWAYPLMNLLVDQGSSQTFTLASSIQRNIKLLRAQLKRFAMGLEVFNGQAQ